MRSTDTATLYEHCVRSIKHGLRFGRHGLPLMGTGDWNDGMNLVGHAGQGRERVAGLVPVREPAPVRDLAARRGDDGFARTCAGQAEELRANIEAHAWDGGWYRRAYFDDGTPLGSSTNDECRIDSISQSWAVISGAGDPVARRPGHGGGRRAPGRPRRRAHQAARPALRYVGPGAGVHQGVRAGCPRERWAIHPRRDMGGDGVRSAGRRGTRLGALLHAQSHQSRRPAGRRRALQSRAVRHVRRHLRRPAPCRAGRMDVVHGRRRLDVQAGGGDADRSSSGSGQASRGAAGPRRVGILQDPLPVPGDLLPHHRHAGRHEGRRGRRAAAGNACAHRGCSRSSRAPGSSREPGASR